MVNKAILVGTLVLVGLVFFIILFFIHYYAKRKEYLKEQEKIRVQFKEELLNAQLEIKEQTLKTISQEIHDNIGQVLSLAKLNLNTIDLSKQAELQDKISDSKKLVSKAIQDLRDLSKSMNTDNIEAIGLVRAIQYEMDMIRKTGFATELNVDGNVTRLEPQKELITFRIIQEVLNNIMKHAEAAEIVISIIYAEKEIKIHVTDNGRGFNLDLLKESNNSNFGLGIRNMHNRAKLIGADFTINSTIGKGTLVAITIPLNNHNL